MGRRLTVMMAKSHCNLSRQIGLSLQPPATSSASNDDVSNQLFAIAQFLNGRLGPNTVAVATLTSDLVRMSPSSIFNASRQYSRSEIWL